MYTYKSRLDRVVDGDTVDAFIDLGFDTHVKKRIRLYGMDAWESRTRDKEEKVKGLAAKARLIQILDENNNEFILVSHGVGKFGRCLGELFITSDSDSINNQLVLEGHAKKYNGGKR
jgi:micrococcal nuclease